jgi:anti-sigma B factor antagonist
MVMHDLVNAQLKAGHNKILLNLAEVSFIDSSGVGDLIGALRVVQSEGGQLLICNASQRIADLLYRTHLDSIMRCYNDEASGIKALSGDGHETISAA